MPITVDELSEAAIRWRPETIQKLAEARALRLRTAFLCHSHLDVTLVKGLVTKLRGAGWQPYVDWQDEQMPETPNRTTAARIRERIVQSDYFLFLATPNAMNSRWCPWEIGYADGKRPPDRIIIIPTIAGRETLGSEYLQLYRRIDVNRQNEIGVWEPGGSAGSSLRNL